MTWFSFSTATRPLKKATAAAVAESMALTPTTTAAASEAERAARAAARMIVPSTAPSSLLSSVPTPTKVSKMSSMASASTTTTEAAVPSSLLFPSSLFDYKNKNVKRSTTIYNNVPNTNYGATTATSAATTTTGTIRTLQDFVRQIPAAVQERKRYNIEPGANEDPIANLFRMSDLAPQAWQQYAFFDTSKPYTRNLIATDNKTYTLLLLCWNPGQESPVHAHPCDGCWLQVLDGQIREVRYDTVGLQPLSDVTYHAGQLSWITDNIGYHKVGNASPLNTMDTASAAAAPSPGQQAATLHLYTPPFKECHFWRDTSDPTVEPSVGKNIHYSEYGFLCSQDSIP
eukprot:CAMPEP_0113476852 /NCGR_PEP_ID=MMETSP0014_2-20120614/19893_1 /TAXON_ID=2857 /ORGANISM="Nitzschia sp." /LENGTH=342 /DNA_ID=CAMNT_0000369903 /DNA_START=289 /DNA_END=1317 /DNA_ORIENTATION=- /assembly_acc=CAM_ASM_000159